MNIYLTWIQAFAVVILSSVSFVTVVAGELSDERAAVSSCRKVKLIPEQLTCFQKLSSSGNGTATLTLAAAYEGKSMKKWNLVKNDQEAIKLKLLAYKQGSREAILWYLNKYTPPKPYKWAIGMSKRQVVNSIDGAPDKIIKTHTESGMTELWIYSGTDLYFGSMKDSLGSLVRIVEKH